MLPLTKITCNPYAPIPEKYVHNQIASDRKRVPELRPTPIGNARREDRIGETRSRNGDHFQHFAPQRAISEMDPALEDEY